MSLEYFEGPAGCGKTYQLIEALKTYLFNRPLADDQAVLGITYMHGSRRRMHSRLAELSPLRGRFVASTVDSVARQLVWRWRTLSLSVEPQLTLSGRVDFDTVCRVAANLLDKQCVFSWFCSRYPVIVVDEFQDCKGDRLRIVQALASCCHVIAAADEFQDLQADGPNPAVAWMKASGGQRTILEGNRRTRQPILLQAAGNLRASQDCGVVLGGCLMSGFNASAAAGGVARTLHWKRCQDVVILTPTAPEKSSFIRDVVNRLTSKPIQPSGVEKQIGPFRITWETNVVEEKTSMLSKLPDLQNGVAHHQILDIASGDTTALKDLRDWVKRKYRVIGQTHFTSVEISEAIDRILQSRRSFLPTERASVIRAMTINQAKNREFKGVVVLWPFLMVGDLGSQRRLLYNALTRAKEWAIVIVQEDPAKTSRLTVPPFSKPPRPKVPKVKKSSKSKTTA